MSSNCKTCGEALGKTGNYTVRILPAKRVPKKARKLMKTMANVDDSAQQATSIETNSFQRFLLKRIRPVNFMEVSCGKCGAISKIKMFKQPLQREGRKDNMSMKKVKESEKNLMSPSITLSSRKSKKKSRDLNAGLSIVLDASKSGDSSSNPQANPASSGRKRPVSAFQKQKEMANLKKVLFHSKKAKKTGLSLHDFLSGI